MNKNSLSQLNKLYVERCRQLTVENQNLKLKVDALEKAIKERNQIIDDMLSNTVASQNNDEGVVAIFENDAFVEPKEESFVTEQAAAPEPEISTPSVAAPTPDFPQLDSISEYATKAISKMVISAAKHSNIITGSSYDNKKDLLNLIIGKCENSKYEISDILQSNNSDAQKALMIDTCVSETIEYFGCVVEQK